MGEREVCHRPRRGYTDGEMSRIHPKDTARALVARYAREDAEISARVETLRRELRRVVPRIARDLGARRVYLFGSLTWGYVFPDFDVDIAVEGLSGAQDDDFAAAVRRHVEAPVDVVMLERAPASLRDRVVSEGELLYPEAELP